MYYDVLNDSKDHGKSVIISDYSLVGYVNCHINNITEYTDMYVIDITII